MTPEQILDMLDNIYQSGYRAYQAGIPLKSMPHKTGSCAANCWGDGWEQARHEDQDAPPND